MIEIREENPADREAIRKVNREAFDDGPEAALVDALRAGCVDYVGFVATENGAVVGHLVFTPTRIDGTGVEGMGLAPMAVLPSHQRQGIGSQLVRHAMDSLRRARCPFVIVLGHPDFYPRFGFERASVHRFRCQWEGVPDEAFMIRVFDANALPEAGGVVRYREEFDEAM